MEYANGQQYDPDQTIDGHTALLQARFEQVTCHDKSTQCGKLAKRHTAQENDQSLTDALGPATGSPEPEA